MLFSRNKDLTTLYKMFLTKQDEVGKILEYFRASPACFLITDISKNKACVLLKQ